MMAWASIVSLSFCEGGREGGGKGYWAGACTHEIRHIIITIAIALRNHPVPWSRQQR